MSFNCKYSPIFGLVFGMSAFAQDYVVDQIDKSFVVDGAPVESIRVKQGESVSFRNGDPFFHNIFSLSDIQIFDLGSYPNGEARSVTFDEPGTVEVECAIHPDMYMTVEVE
ncbi:MAG: plastocyanin/azurin family copper-binding protein [Haliea sp.]|nr:plastocyanin/azurin family copper-binding protein [Haliea sp.]